MSIDKLKQELFPNLVERERVASLTKKELAEYLVDKSFEKVKRMRKARQIEVGDLVVTAKGCETIVSYDKSKPVFIDVIKKDNWRIKTQSGFYIECDVKCIRNQRKGSQEARDIVAMLAGEYRKYMIEVFDIASNNEYTQSEKRELLDNAKIQALDAKTRYLKAKSMLKEGL